jgi:N-formylglutamate amidohydrolase
VHALQVEISRALYMDEQRIEPATTLSRLQRDLETFVAELSTTNWSQVGLSSPVA